MNILITGGAGFIGSHLADHFSKENKVFILDNFSTGRLENIDQGRCITIKGDIRNKELLDSIMQDMDYVFHEAALISVPLSMKDPSGTIKINTLGTLNVLESAHRLCHAEKSSMGRCRFQIGIVYLKSDRFILID